MLATITIASSDEALAALDTAHAKMNAWRRAAFVYTSLKAQGATLGDSGIEMETSRTNVYAAIDDAEQMMRDELRAL